MVILPNAIFLFNTVPIKITMNFCTEIEKSILKYTLKHKKPSIDKAILRKKSMLKVLQCVTSNIPKSHNNKNSMVLTQKQAGNHWT
jgi:hypothetical protein